MSRRQVVVLGMMTKIPVAGVVWQTLHYLVGLERLGYQAYYVEAHARTPSMLMEGADDDGSTRAAAFIASSVEPFGFAGRWVYQALHADGRCYGLSQPELDALFASAALIINLHGGTEPRPEHIATDRLVYLETDPVEVEVQLAEGRQRTIDYLQPHCAWFTFAENYGRPDCGLPVSQRFLFQPTRQPVVLDFWPRCDDVGNAFTTIGNWRQEWREITFESQTYSWSKHHEFLKFLTVPGRTGKRFELALATATAEDRDMLERNGWHVRDALSVSRDIHTYRDYISGSQGEFTVAKEQNVRFRTGWFSDRSATYLAAGRPVIMQDTGFGSMLPTGEGLFAFSTIEDIDAAVEAIRSDHERHSRAASAIAREYFDATRVIGSLLERVGMPRVPPGLVISLSSRRPTTLPAETVERVVEAPLPVTIQVPAARPRSSVLVVTRDGLVFTRLCLESVLASLGMPDLEVVVVDNASTDGTRDYIGRLAERDGRVRLIANERNVGFAAAVNQGLAAARGEVLVVLNNDVIVPPHSLAMLCAQLRDAGIGLVGPVSNEAATEAEIETAYSTYGGVLATAEERRNTGAAGVLDVPMLTMFAVALRRDVYERVGVLDEGFDLALFEDDDYCIRVRNAGYRVVCAEDVFIHHFGEASLGALVPTGEHAALFEKNRHRFETKWGVQWQPHARRQSHSYLDTVREVQRVIRRAIPEGARVLVVSKGDDDLVALDGRLGAHFPQTEGGVYAGHHPKDSDEAIAELERERTGGAQYLVIPRTSLWWLDHYAGFRQYLGTSCREVVRRDDVCVIYALGSRG
jgi:GT2 family glycosyltransferase